VETFYHGNEDDAIPTTRLGFVKDLRIIANRELSDLIIIDNSVLSFLFQIDNGVPILPFYTNKHDEELLHLSFYLKCLAEQASGTTIDVRSHNREAFGLYKLVDMDL
jgi:CTD small phosphatase-like protein 2